MVMRVIPELYDQLPSNPVEMLLISFDSQDQIATFCAVTPQAVYNWKIRESIPAMYIPELSRYSGVPTWMLCPKHFKKGESDGVVQSDNEGDGQD